MVIIGKISFPPESAYEMGKRFSELPPLPDYMTMKGPYIRGMMERGIQGIEIFDLSNDKLAKGIEFVTNRYITYFGIPGFKYHVAPYTQLYEALKMVGLG
jgi:hypothetical protein